MADHDVIVVSDDDDVIEVSDDEDDDENYMQEDDVPEGPFILEVRFDHKFIHAQFSLPNGHDLPMAMLYPDGMVTSATILHTPRASLTSVAAQAHWDAACLAHVLTGMPVPESNLLVFIDGCACMKSHTHPTFTITVK